MFGTAEAVPLQRVGSEPAEDRRAGAVVFAGGRRYRIGLPRFQGGRTGRGCFLRVGVPKLTEGHR
jgi:hypothetical protein